MCRSAHGVYWLTGAAVNHFRQPDYRLLKNVVALPAAQGKRLRTQCLSGGPLQGYLEGSAQVLLGVMAPHKAACSAPADMN